jgi:pimeloyl-ACP methyl ester carboxylesterase
MAASIVVFAALVAVADPGDHGGLVRFGGDLAEGVLVNHTPNARPTDPPDPARPTVIFVHGFNPLPRAIHFGMAERLSGAFARRGGPPLNLFEWNWNAASFAKLDPRANRESAVAQGRLLATSLLQSVGAPERTHLIGHSSGCIVAASAARSLQVEHARPVAHLTLLDPATMYHHVVFDQLAAGSSASLVENFWSPGPSGYGRAVPRAGVWNTRVDGPSRYLGAVWPLRSNHLHVVEWYAATAGDPSYPGGFNTSLLLRAGGR